MGATSDIYSLGAVLYEMLVGAPVYTGERMEVMLAHVQEDVPELPKTLRPRCRSSEYLDRLLSKGLTTVLLAPMLSGET